MLEESWSASVAYRQSYLDPQEPVRLRSFSAQNQEFVDAIRAQRQPAVTAADGRAAVELAQAVLQSVHSGATLSVYTRAQWKIDK